MWNVLQQNEHAQEERDLKQVSQTDLMHILLGKGESNRRLDSGMIWEGWVWRNLSPSTSRENKTKQSKTKQKKTKQNQHFEWPECNIPKRKAAENKGLW